jgi:hypothetical protein
MQGKIRALQTERSLTFMSCFDTAGEKPETLAAMQIEIRL